MTHGLLLLVIVTAILALSWLAARWLTTEAATKDLIWRTALIAVAASPLLLAAREKCFPWKCSLPVLAPASESFSPEGNERIAAVGTDRHISPQRDDGFEASADKVGPLVAAQISSRAESFDVRPGDLVALLVTWVPWIWLVGTSYCLVRLAIGYYHTARFIISSQPTRDESALAALDWARRRVGLRGSVVLAVSPFVRGPVATGIFHRHILIPAELLASSSRTQLRAALLHECAHFRRHDTAFNVLLQIVSAVLWPHPLMYVMRREMRQLREELCDNFVLSDESPVNYAEVLLQLSIGKRVLENTSVGLGIFSTDGQLERRVQGLLAPQRSLATRTSRTARCSLASVVLLSIMAILALRFDHGMAVSGEQPPPPPSPRSNLLKDSEQETGGNKDQSVRSKHLVRGLVVSKADESPVGGAAIYLLADPQEGFFLLPTQPRKTQSDAMGRFEFADVPIGSYRVWGEAGNRISNEKSLNGESVRVTDQEAPKPVTLRLIDGCRFRISVLAKSDKRPIAGAVVRFRWPDIERKFEAAANGIALVEGARSQRLVLEVRADGYAMDVRDIAATKLGTTTEFTFLLAPGGQIRGLVRNAQGAPLVGARVGARVGRTPANLDLDSMDTDQQGRFLLDNVPLAESIKLSVSQEEFLDHQQDLVLSAAERVSQVELTMQHRPTGGSITITVVGHDEQPIVGAKLINPSHTSSLERIGITNERGEARIDDVYHSHGRYELNVTADGFAPARVSFQPGTAAQPAPVRVKLEPGHRIRGRVLLSDGKPAAKVRVYYNEGEHGNPLGGRVETDAEGRFAIDSLPADCTFTIYSPNGYAPYEDKPLALDRDDEVVVALEPAGIVKGHVVDDATGNRLVPYRIRIMSSPNHRSNEPTTGMPTRLVEEGLVITDPAAEFQFGDYPPGMPMQLIVSAEGYDSSTVDRIIAKTATELKPIEIRMKKTDPTKLRNISGRLVNHAGIPVAGAHVRLWTGKSAPRDPNSYPFNWTMITTGQLARSPKCRQFFTAVTDSDGQFSFPAVSSADYAEIAYWGNGISAGRKPFAMTATTVPQRIELQAAAPGKLIVEVDRQAWPTAGQVSVSGSNGGVFDYVHWTIGSGEFRHTFDDIPAGNVIITLQTAGHRVGSNRLELQALTSQNAELRSGEAATVTFGPFK